MAVETTSIRIGTLVANPILRPPAVLARAAATIDAFCDGRLDLGIGTGIAAFDHEATGTPVWPMAERLDRFREYVTIVDEILRAAPEPVTVEGRHLVSRGLGLGTTTPQRPRPPLILGGQSPAVLRLVAERADGWNTHGRFGASPDEILERTAEQHRRLDGLCESVGRDPSTVRRSLLLYDALDAWTTDDAFERIVNSFTRIGTHEFVVFWPREDQRQRFERAALTTIPAYRA
jgi:alkanesulfonate monooxygenase SsuD/methylene tetrahydromethanopterin reductase-like flavin-dependent oxidoreductase (luciferase family)